jgi:hypothetical protein
MLQLIHSGRVSTVHRLLGRPPNHRLKSLLHVAASPATSPYPTQIHPRAPAQGLRHRRGDLDRTLLAVVERHTVAHADGLAAAAALASNVDDDVLEAELEPRRFNARCLVLLIDASLLLTGQHGILLRPRGLFELVKGISGLHHAEDVLLHRDQLRVRRPFVRGEHAAVERLCGVLARELSRLGHGDEELLHRQLVDVQLVDGLVFVIRPGLREVAPQSLCVRRRQLLSLSMCHVHVSGSEPR